MIKCKADTPEGPLVVLGLSDGNVAELKKDRPILFSMAELQLDPENVLISYCHPDGRAAAAPRDTEIHLAIVLTDEVLASMGQHPVHQKIRGVRFLLYRGKDEATMEADLRPLIGPNSRVTRRGWSPSDAPPSMN